jgi:hypothetical protein
VLERLEHDQPWLQQLKRLGLERIGRGGGTARMAADIVERLNGSGHA